LDGPGTGWQMADGAIGLGHPPPRATRYVSRERKTSIAATISTSGTAFGGINFSSPAGQFVLTGNPIILTNGVSRITRLLVAGNDQPEHGLGSREAITVGKRSLCFPITGAISGASTGITLLGARSVDSLRQYLFSGNHFEQWKRLLILSDANGTAPASGPCRVTSSF